MATTRYSTHVVEILQDVKDKLATVTDIPVFVGARPTTNSKQRSEMIVINLPYSVRSNGAIQTTYLRIEIIVKDKNEGRSNIARLEEISNKLMELFPIYTDRYVTKVPNLVLSGKDSIGYTIWNLQTNVIVSKLDTYNN